jgi:hypothetical protein
MLKFANKNAYTVGNALIMSLVIAKTMPLVSG